VADLDFTPGRWAVVPGWMGGRLQPEARRIDAVTLSIVKTRVPSGRFTHCLKPDVMATVATEKAARDLVSAIDGIRGEQERRVRAAGDAAEAALSRMLEKFNG